jgi:N-methylhydantoinase B
LLTEEHTIVTDSGGPGEYRGGCGLRKGATFLDTEGAVISYCADRERSVTWGIDGGLPGVPQGVQLDEGEGFQQLGTVFSNRPVEPGDRFTRPSSGGGGFGDPLERDPEKVREDVVDEYVSVERAERDYGVVIEPVDPERCEYEIDHEATERARERIRENRHDWLEADPEAVAARYRDGELSELDLIRRYGVIVDRSTGELLERTTEQFREMLQRRAAAHWE